MGGGTFPPAAYGFRQRAGTERRTIWVSHSRPATEPPSVPALPANLAPGRSLGFGQILPGSEADPGDWVALCYALASLAVSLSLPFFCLPGRATEPVVCVFFVIGRVRAESDAAATPFLPPRLA